MKKSFIFISTFLLIVQILGSEQIDNIVLLDTSESMFPYYSGTIDYLIEDIVKEQLQSLDTFHLLSFNDYPEYEISRTIRGEDEITDILNRIFLLQPIGKYTDLIAAFSYLYEYTSKLQLNSIKKIIILTDGIHDPPPGSPYPVSSDNSSKIVKISENMRRQGWDVSLIQFPLDNSGDSSNKTSSNTSDSENNLFPIIAKTLDEQVITLNSDNLKNTDSHELTGAPEIIYPGDLGSVAKRFKLDIEIINHSPEPVLLNLAAVNTDTFNMLETAISLKLDSGETKTFKLILNLADSYTKGQVSIPVELVFDDSYRAYPRKSILNLYYDPQLPDVKNIINSRVVLYIIIGFVLIFALVYILIHAIRNINHSAQSISKPDKTERYKSDSMQSTNTKKRFKNKSNENIPGQIAIEMVVKNQNRRIGHRNIHFLGESHPRSVGGAGSEYFLIFIIATGKRIGEIVLENDVVSFIPKAKEFFPDLSGQKLINCLSVPIRVINKDRIETIIEFNEWISPVDRLNRIMHLIDKSGMPDFNY
jgi:VWA domain-containing protein